VAKACEIISLPGTIYYMRFLLDPDWIINPKMVCNLASAEASLIHTVLEITFRVEDGAGW
jgi:hypothetical protein